MYLPPWRGLGEEIDKEPLAAREEVTSQYHCRSLTGNLQSETGMESRVFLCLNESGLLPQQMSVQ